MPIQVAHYRGRIEVFELFCAFADDLTAVDHRGATVLMSAVLRRNRDAVRLLLQLNVDTTKKTKAGWSVSQTSYEEIRQLLFEHSKKSVNKIYSFFVLYCFILVLLFV